MSTNPGLLIVVSAPSGAGKTSLVRALTSTLANIACATSHTTRAQRPLEVDGEHYHFIDPEGFEAMVAAGAFLEHATVFDHAYGTSRAEVERRWRAGQDVILEIDWQGAAQVRACLPSVRSIFILPPSLAELERRLTGRAGSTPEGVARRMRDAVAEMSHYQEYDYLVLNDNFDIACESLVSIVRAERARTPIQALTLRPTLGALLAGLPPGA